jgi:hypothetical protein
MSHIKQLENEIFIEKQRIAQDVKKSEIEWNDLVKINKAETVMEKAKKVEFIKEKEKKVIADRCISQMMVRERRKSEYDGRIHSLKTAQNEALKILQELEKQADFVMSPKSKEPIKAKVPNK